jgi:hypothetical protein
MADCFWTDLVGVSQNCGGGGQVDFAFSSADYTQVLPLTSRYAVGRGYAQLDLIDNQADNSDNVVGRLNMPNTGRGIAVLGGRVYWMGATFPSSASTLLDVCSIELSDILGVFGSYSGPTPAIANIVLAAVEAPVGICADPDLNCLFIAVNRIGSGGIMSTWKHNPGDALTEWSAYASIPPPPVGNYSDAAMEFDYQYRTVTICANNGQGPEAIEGYVFSITNANSIVVAAYFYEYMLTGNRAQLKYWGAINAFVGVTSDNELVAYFGSSRTSIVSNVTEGYPVADEVLVGFIPDCSTPAFAVLRSASGATRDTDIDLTLHTLDARVVDADNLVIYGQLQGYCS